MVAGRMMWRIALCVAAALAVAVHAAAAPLARGDGFVAEGYGSGWCAPTAQVMVRAENRRIDIRDPAFQKFFGTLRIALSLECPQAVSVQIYTDVGGNVAMVGEARASDGWTLLARGEAPAEGAATVSLPKCNAVADLGTWAAMRITSARLSDRPSDGPDPMFIRSGDVGGYWVVEYQVMPRVNAPYQWSVNQFATKAVDSDGNKWSWIRLGRFTAGSDIHQPSGHRGRLGFLLYYKQPTARSMKMSVEAKMTLPGPRRWNDKWATLRFDFPPLPINCADEPTAAPPAIAEAPAGPGGAGAQTANLIVPQQVDKPGVSKPNAPTASVRYAVQIGFIWAFGQGVYPDYDQALAWYREAERRQAAQKDYRSQNEIRLAIGELTISDIGTLLGRGQRKAMAGDWEYARLFFGLAAARGDVQGMAALGWVYGDIMKNPGMQIYWCRRAFRGARASKREYEIDAVNHFCPLQAFTDLMTPAERKENEKSIARARAKSAAIRRDAQTAAAIARLVVSGGPSSGQTIDDEVASDINRAQRYGRGAERSPPPPPQTSGLYGNCHGGPAYGC